MRDIVYKKKEPAVEISTPLTVDANDLPSVESSPASKTIGFFVGLIGWFKKKMEPPLEPLIIQPSYTASLHQEKEVIKVKVKKKGFLKTKLASTTDKVRQNSAKTKQAVGNTAKHLKTPWGKVAAVHTLALIGLFSYITYSHGNSSVFYPKEVGSAVQNADLRKYLPNPGTAPKVEAFPEHSIAPENSSFTYHTWLTPWNIDTVQHDTVNYQSVSAFWLTVQPNGYDVTPKADWKLWQDFRKGYTKATPAYYLTVNGDPNAVYLSLASQSVQQKQLQNILQILEQQNFNGVDFDYEGLGIENKTAFTEFVRNAAILFHAHNKTVAVTLEARIANQVPMDWHSLSQIADQVRIMAYDYHGRTTTMPGAITPLGWLQEILNYAQTTIDSTKLVIGLGNYGYDWTIGDTQADSSTVWNGVGVSYDQALAIAQENKTPIIRSTGIDDHGYDIGSVPFFVYKDDQSRQHTVFFEDKASLESKLNLISQYKNQGTIFWKVGITTLSNSLLTPPPIPTTPN